MNHRDWDEFASIYAAIQQESKLPIEQDVSTVLAARYPLATMTVGEIAAGSGRYTLPLAPRAQAIIANDWSAEMLVEAKRWLDQHDIRNVTYQHADWQTLPVKPIADLIFVSQLPTLAASDLTRLSTLATTAVAVNTQSGQANAALAQLAAHLGWTLPPSYQADPERVASYYRQLEAAQVGYHHQTFTYQQPEVTTPTELLTAFARPFSLSQATAAAVALGLTNANTPLTTTVTYTFELLDWRVS